MLDAILIVSGEMPLADHAGRIALLLERLRECYQIRRQVTVRVFGEFIVRNSPFF